MRHEMGFRRCSMNYGSRSRDIGEGIPEIVAGTPYAESRKSISLIR